MSKKVKNLISEELRSRYKEVDSVLLVDPIGLNAVETNRLRGSLKAKDISLLVVKNSLARRALADGPLSALGDRLRGSNALAIGGASIVDVARELAELKKGLAALEIKGAIAEGRLFDAAGAAQLATVPGRAELQGTIVTLAMSPGARLAGALVGPFRRIAGCLQAIVESQEGSKAAEEPESQQG